jgi:hypothetical protein
VLEEQARITTATSIAPGTSRPALSAGHQSVAPVPSISAGAPEAADHPAVIQALHGEHDSLARHTRATRLAGLAIHAAPTGHPVTAIHPLREQTCLVGVDGFVHGGRIGTANAEQ